LIILSNASVYSGFTEFGQVSKVFDQVTIERKGEMLKEKIRKAEEFVDEEEEFKDILTNMLYNAKQQKVRLAID
jgi:hypothetical protein